MKAFLQRCRFIAPVATVPSLDVEAKATLGLELADDFVLIRQLQAGHAVPLTYVPLSNVASFVVRPEPKQEAKK